MDTCGPKTARNMPKEESYIGGERKRPREQRPRAAKPGFEQVISWNRHRESVRWQGRNGMLHVIRLTRPLTISLIGHLKRNKTSNRSWLDAPGERYPLQKMRIVSHKLQYYGMFRSIANTIVLSFGHKAAKQLGQT